MAVKPYLPPKFQLSHVVAFLTKRLADRELLNGPDPTDYQIGRREEIFELLKWFERDVRFEQSIENFKSKMPADCISVTQGEGENLAEKT